MLADAILAGRLSYGMRGGPLLGPPSKWEPALIQRELARLECDMEAEELVRLADLNARLKRLGIKSDLRPVRQPLPSKPKPRETIVHTPQQRIRRTPRRRIFSDDEIRKRIFLADATGVPGAVEREIEHMKALELAAGADDPRARGSSSLPSFVPPSFATCTMKISEPSRRVHGQLPRICSTKPAAMSPSPATVFSRLS